MNKDDYLSQIIQMQAGEELKIRIANLPNDFAISDTIVKKKRQTIVSRFAIMAACLMLVAAGLQLALNRNFGSAPPGFGSGGSGHDGGTVFDFYAGPVLPLTVLGDTWDILAERKITYDFSGFGPSEPHGRYTTDVNITDSYVIKNNSTEDKKLTLLYPFVSSLREFDRYLPTLTVDGRNVDPRIHLGDYAGSFNLNPEYPSSWDAYAGLLANEAYLDTALRELPQLNNEVTIYTFADLVWTEDIRAATLAMEFYIDPQETTILTYGMNGAEYNMATGYRRYSAFLSHLDESGVIIVIGEPLADYTLAFYENGACDKEILGSGTVNVSESTLSDVLRNSTEHYSRWHAVMHYPDSVPDSEFLYRASVYMLKHSGIGSEYMSRYEGRLDDLIGNAHSFLRVIYAAADVTVPANGSITVSADLLKGPSYDFYCRNTENKNVYGYDMVTRLGSTLNFQSLFARLLLHDSLEVVRQNMGFKTEEGIYEVALDLNVPYYYIQVKLKQQTSD